MGAKERGGPAVSALLEESETSIAHTLTLFREAAPGEGQKVEWKEVLAAAEGVAKHATSAGILWKGKVSKKEGFENISSYVGALQKFLLLSHGSTTGAGTTLLLCIKSVSEQVATSSLGLLRSAVAGKSNKTQEVDLPVLVGCVWEACEAVKKSPSSNRVAVGRSLTQVAISVKDVLRELGDFKQESGLQCTSDADTIAEAEGSSSDESTQELSNKLSAVEMQVVQSVKNLVLSLLSMLKQLLHIVAGTSSASRDAQRADSETTLLFEKLLKLSKDLGVSVDELGASLYPPQEVETLQATTGEIEGFTEHIEAGVFGLLGSIPEDFGLAVSTSKDAAASLNRILDASASTFRE